MFSLDGPPMGRIAKRMSNNIVLVCLINLWGFGLWLKVFNDSSSTEATQNLLCYDD